MKLRGVAAAVAAAFLLAVAFPSCAGLSGAVSLSDHGTAAPAVPRMFWTARPAPASAARGTLYVQGTLHMGTAGLFPLDARVIEAMARSDAVFAELGPEGMAAAQGLVLERMASSTLAGGTDLRSMLPTEEASWLEAYMGSATLGSLSGFEPWVAYSALDQFAAARAGLDPNLGVDAELFAAARRLGKPVQGLETAEFQLRMLSGPAQSVQLLLLRDSIREYRDRPDTLRRVYEAYRDDDRKALARELRTSIARSEAFAPELAEFTEALLSNRNAAWAAIIAAALDDGKTVFVFAGAAHFVGDGNVLDRLESLGYRIEPRP